MNSSFSNTSVVLPTSQLILQPFRCFTYVTARCPTLLSLLLRHRIFTYVTWRAAHVITINILNSCPTQGGSKTEMRWSPYIQGLRIARMPADHAWRTITGTDEIKWNETNEISVKNDRMKFVAGGNGRNPKKNLPGFRFVHHETHMEWPRCELGITAEGGERLTICATESIYYNRNFSILKHIYLYDWGLNNNPEFFFSEIREWILSFSIPYLFITQCNAFLYLII